MNYKLSVCLPAHRTHLWENFYNSLVESIGNKYSWELIMVGPKDHPSFVRDKPHVKFIKDFGSPSRCGQMATTEATGELMMMASDDGLFVRGAIEQSIDLMNTLPRKDVLALRFTEGRDYKGAPMHPEYWMAHHHPPLRVVPPDYKIILLGMFRLDYFREMGGWDCRFEHLNMNGHDLAFRMQKNGTTVHMSPGLVCNHNWNPNSGDHIPVQAAYDNCDLKLFREITAPGHDRPLKIDYDNWKKSPKVWKRRFGDMNV